MKKLITNFVLLFLIISAFAQTEVQKGLEAITDEAVKGQLEFLASDWTEGRALGTKGAYLAADYIASMFKVYGVQPFGDEEYTTPSREERMAGVRPEPFKTYYQNFSLLQYSAGTEQTFTLLSKTGTTENELSFGYKSDFSVRTGTVAQAAKAPLVFLGYGFTDKNGNYDDYKKTDVAGKIVIILDGFPGHRDSTSAAYKKFAPKDRWGMYEMENDKMTRLKDNNVAAIIAISDYNPTLSWAQNQIYPVKGDYYEADEVLNSYYDSRMVLPGDSLVQNIPVFTVTPRVVNELLKGSGINIEQFESNAANEMLSNSKELSGKSIAFKTTVDTKIIKVRNVVGIVEGEKTDEFIVVGGHYDHLGKWNGWIWNGADDNASGTVGVMTIAKAFIAAGKKPEKSVIFAAWTAEEKGLFGSKYFVQQAQKSNLNLVLNLNYDMIARNVENDSLKNKASLGYTKANAGIEEITRKLITDNKINLDLEYRPAENPSGGSDYAPFAQAGIPVFYFMAAMHPDYHQPSDELSKINWEKMANIIRIGFLDTWEFANNDEYLIPIKQQETVTPEP